MQKINADTILAGIKQAVNVAGADTYRSCFYALYENPINPDAPAVDYDTAFELLGFGQKGDPIPVDTHCIVGTVLHDLGVPLSALRKVEGTSVSDVVVSEADNAGVYIDPEGWEALYAAQSTQDDGKPWGQAQEAAERIVGRIREADAEGYDASGDYVHRTFTDHNGYRY